MSQIYFNVPKDQIKHYKEMMDLILEARKDLGNRSHLFRVLVEEELERNKDRLVERSNKLLEKRKKLKKRVDRNDFLYQD